MGAFRRPLRVLGALVACRFEKPNRNDGFGLWGGDSAGLCGKVGIGVLFSTCQEWLEMSRTMLLLRV